MSSTDVSPVVSAMVTLIQAVSNIGLVHAHDLWAHDDLRPLVVSAIDNEDTLRAWFITGPRMESEKAEQRSAGYQQRTWTYTIHGIEGLTEDGDSIVTLRNNALAVSDKLDAAFTLSSTCHRTWPATWPVKPEHRLTPFGAVAYVEIEKRVLTLSTP